MPASTQTTCRLESSQCNADISLVALALALAGCARASADSQQSHSDEQVATSRQALTNCDVFSASDDAMLSNPPMDGNFGALPILRVGGKDESVLQFDLGAVPPAAVIQSASLKLYSSSSGSSVPVNVHRVTSQWAEGSVTYASLAQRFEAAAVGSIVVTGSNVQKSVDVTSLVANWVTGLQPNFGVLLETSSSKKTIFVSREGGTAEQKPKLDVCFVEADDHCSPNPCLNYATCENAADGFLCHCGSGYTGTTCETNIDDCASGPCLNGGTCSDGVNGYSCACSAGFAGANCEVNVDDCAPNPCQNNGVCTDDVAKYSCACPPRYSGANCEILIDECAAQPCQNGSVCTNTEAGYSCECAPGFSGTNCEIDIDDCVSQPCHNGGTCIDGVNTFTCSCPPDWGGSTCDVNLNSCAQHPCLNGAACVNGLGNYTCTCAPGFAGANCEIDVDDCTPNPCENGGVCVDGVNVYSCTCAPGFAGANCEINLDVDDCTPNPCQNLGICVDGVNAHSCTCPLGFSGPNCETFSTVAFISPRVLLMVDTSSMMTDHLTDDVTTGGDGSFGYIDPIMSRVQSGGQGGLYPGLALVPPMCPAPDSWSFDGGNSRMATVKLALTEFLNAPMTGFVVPAKAVPTIGDVVQLGLMRYAGSECPLVDTVAPGTVSCASDDECPTSAAGPEFCIGGKCSNDPNLCLVADNYGLTVKGPLSCEQKSPLATSFRSTCGVKQPKGSPLCATIQTCVDDSECMGTAPGRCAAATGASAKSCKCGVSGMGCGPGYACVANRCVYDEGCVVDGGEIVVDPRRPAYPSQPILPWLDGIEDRRPRADGTLMNPELRASGSNPLAGAMRTATTWYQNLKNSGEPYFNCRPHSLVLITDGADSCDDDGSLGPITAAQAFVAATVAGAPGLNRVYVIELGSRSPLHDAIARVGGTGAARRVTSRRDLDLALREILADLPVVSPNPFTQECN